MIHEEQTQPSASLRRVRLWLLCAAALLPSCSVFRPMPTHGGGKRFDEEQRLVSATVQHTAGRIEYSRLRRSKVALEVASLETSGGLQDRYDSTGNKARVTTQSPYPGFQKLFDYRMNPWLQSNTTVTNQDVLFLEKCLESQLRSRNYQVVGRDTADIHMIVLVDCLGTNHSRKDLAVAFRDQLAVTCAITWYVIDARTQEVLVPARSLVSHGTYEELNVRGTPWDSRKRDLGVVTEDDPLMLNPKSAQVAKGSRGSAPVAALEQGMSGSSGGPSGGSPGMRFRDVPIELPKGVAGDLSPDLLPPLDNGPDAMGKPTPEDFAKMPIGELIQAAWARSREKDVEGLRAAITEIRKKKPDAPALEKLNERLGQLEKKQP